MGKLLSIKEFDTIVGNESYKAEYPYLPQPIFKELLQYIHEYEITEENTDVLDFVKISYKRDVGETVTVKNYVGLIQLKSGHQIEILPKISLSADDENNGITKRIFIKMLRTLKDFPCKVFSEADLKTDRMNLYEIFIRMFLQETRRLVQYGLKSSYINTQDNLPFYKGKLLVNENIKENLAHRERFFVSYDEFSPDCAENKLIKAALLKLQSLTGSEKNSKEIRQLLISFENVNESVNFQKDFAKVNIDRTKKEYETLMKWAKVFLLNKSFSAFSGSTDGRALLFPMESVFESYVAKLVKTAFLPEQWGVSVQDKGEYLFTEPRKQFALRPDIILRKDGRCVIMDTKWKKLSDNESINYGISQADMYQMYAYSKKYNASEIWLLYPISAEMNGRQIRFDSGDGTVVNVFFVDLENAEESIGRLLEFVREH